MGEGRACVDDFVGDEVRLHVKMGSFGEDWRVSFIWAKILLEKEGRKYGKKGVGLNCSMPSDDVAIIQQASKLLESQALYKNKQANFPSMLILEKKKIACVQGNILITPQANSRNP